MLTTFRIVVRRPPSARGSVDSVECTTTNSRVVRTLSKLDEHDRLEVEGSLHRRFWRGAGGVQSRYAVDVETARRVRADA